MSRPAHLPPRCPPQNKLATSRLTNSTCQTSLVDDEPKHSKHHRFPSQGSAFEEHPLWLNDLLMDSEAGPKSVFHRRSASDSAAILDASADFESPVSSICGENLRSSCSQTLQRLKDIDADSGFEADYVYGPNSPRQKNKLTQSESSMVSALLDCVPQNPLQYLAVNPSGDIRSEIEAPADDDPESEKAPRRRSGQRSRVRKLQYIAELEKTVNVLQQWEADLAAKVNSLRQQRVALSIDNKKLKWQLINLRQQSLRKDDEGQSLKNEVEKLKMVYGMLRRTKGASFSTMGPAEADSLILDMRKLSLKGSTVPLRNSFRG